MNNKKTFFAKNRKKWREWLQKYHQSKKEIWLIYYKKHTGQATVSYAEAVEEALCFGWIDGVVNSIDDGKYMQRYTPRRPKSAWSEINIQRAKKMIKAGSITEEGLKVYREGMKNQTKVPSAKNFSIPAYLKTALIKNEKAWNNFQKFSPSAKLLYVHWINTAKREETRLKRIEKTIQQLKRNLKFWEK